MSNNSSNTIRIRNDACKIMIGRWVLRGNSYSYMTRVIVNSMKEKRKGLHLGKTTKIAHFSCNNIL